MNRIGSILLAGGLILSIGKVCAEEIVGPSIEKFSSSNSTQLDNFVALKPGGPMSRRGGCPMFPKLKLTDEQMEKAIEIKLRAQKKALPIKSELADLKNELRKVLTVNQVDKGKARSIHNEISSNMKSLASIKFDAMLEMSDNLTEKQKKRIKHKMLKHELMFGRMGPMGRPGFMPPPPPPFDGPPPAMIGAFGPPPHFGGPPGHQQDFHEGEEKAL